MKAYILFLIIFTTKAVFANSCVSFYSELINSNRNSYSHLNELIRLPEIKPNYSANDLRNLEFGSYKLIGEPTHKFLQELILWGEGAKEAGLLSFQGVWILTLIDRLEVGIPKSLRSFAGEGLLKFNLHTHPVDIDYAIMPSFGDLETLNLKANNKIYIASHRGISVVTANKDPWFHPLFEFRDWAKLRQRPLDDPQYRSSGWHADFIKFLTELKMFKFIPWSNVEEIQKILSEGRRH